MHANGRGEIEPALSGRLPKLVAYLDLHALLHGHIATETLETLEKAIRLESVRDHPQPPMPT